MTDGQTDGGDCNIPDAFLKKLGDNKRLLFIGKIKTFAVNIRPCYIEINITVMHNISVLYCKFGNFCESLIFAKLRICEVS